MIGVRALLLGAVGLCGMAYAAPPAVRGGDLTGVWWIEHYDPLLTAQEGAIPFTDAGKQLYEKNKAALAAGSVADTTVTKCLPMGLPRAMNSAYPFQIVQHAGLITVLNEENHMPWFIALTDKHPNPDDLDPTFMGDSIGQWNGNVLTVDSIGFKPVGFLDATGIPHSEQLHVTQQLRLAPGGKHLEATITVQDPQIFSKAWTIHETYVARPDVELMEFVCGEPNRALYGDKAGGVHLTAASATAGSTP